MKLVRKTQDLVVRPFRAGDFKAWQVAHMAMQPRKRNQWDFAGRPKSELTQAVFQKNVRDTQKNIAADRTYSLAVFLKKGNYIGMISLMDVSRGPFQNAYVGYRIHNGHWGRGYGKQAVKAVLDIAFRDLKLHRVEAGVEPRNRRSIGLARSVGMRREGLSRKRLHIDGRWLDLVIFAATCEDLKIKWKGKRK